MKYREHEPVVEWMRSKFCPSPSVMTKMELDVTKIDSAMEIASGICGIEGCNYTCRTPCEAIKFVILHYMAKDTPETERERILENSIGRYG